ncbi:uncharacterized protein [Paralichthys olivaceus]|uniref:uncharacterized protein isoform X2 n=1 Tax=Paralichthys olivaceus TaxID=8255 RepID=UPI003751EB8C
MVGTAHIVETLILLSLIRKGVDGEESLTSADRGYDITFPCEEDMVCFHLWKSSRSRSQIIAIISNGEIQRFKSKEESCTLRMEHPTTGDVGHHRCQQRSNGISTYETPKGKGRVLVIDPGPEIQGRNQDMIGAAVGVAGCVVLSAAVAVFVLNRRRTNNQLSEGPCSDKSSTITVVNTDDVIYADIILPSGSDRVWDHDCESTEYSCVRYK